MFICQINTQRYHRKWSVDRASEELLAWIGCRVGHKTYIQYKIKSEELHIICLGGPEGSRETTRSDASLTNTHINIKSIKAKNPKSFNTIRGGRFALIALAERCSMYESEWMLRVSWWSNQANAGSTSAQQPPSRSWIYLRILRSDK